MAEVKLNILYEDNHIIVTEKPPMIPSQADSSGTADMLSLVKKYVKEKYGKPGEVYIGLVHRLDRPVGGLMVFARTSKAASRLSEQIRQRDMEKGYAAFVHGKAADEGEMRDLLLHDGKTNRTSLVRSGTPGAKEALLRYKTVERNDKGSLVLIELETGRHHQIRVQFASRKLPLYGDIRYGNRNEKGNIALLSYRLSFTHPVKKERMLFELDYRAFFAGYLK